MKSRVNEIDGVVLVSRKTEQAISSPVGLSINCFLAVHRFIRLLGTTQEFRHGEDRHGDLWLHYVETS